MRALLVLSLTVLVGCATTVSQRPNFVHLASEQPAGGEAAAPAAKEPAASPGVPNPLSVRGAIGFTLDPDTFLMAFQGDYFLDDQLSLGPLLQLGVDDDTTILAPTLNVQYAFDLTELEEDGDEILERLKPFVQGGVGLGYIHKDRRRGDDDDVGFLLNLGFGLEYYLTDQLALGNNLLFNILPDKTNGENFFLSWQFVTLRYRF
jgi:hypothetical protein